MNRLGANQRLGIAVVAIAVATAALPTPAPATSGATVLALDGPVANVLRERGVRIRPLRPARGGPRRIVLPIAAGLAGADTTLLRHRGGISFEAGDGEEVRLARLRLLLGDRSLVEAKLGGEEIGLFKVLRGGRRDVDPTSGRARLGGLRLKLTRGAARTLASRLGSGTLPAKRFGTLSASLSGLTRGEGPRQGGGSSPDSPAQQASTCPLPSGAGPSAEGTPPVATRPPNAVDLTGATIEWHVRESFIRYIATGEGTSVSGGATADPPMLLPGASAALSYDFHFPFANGWLDTGANPSSPGDDTAALYFSGALRFLYSGHGIDLVAGAPEIELAGSSSRAIFAISGDGGAAQRQVLVNLDLSRAGAIEASGNAFTYERVPGAIPSGTASSVFAGFYAPGTDFGCFNLSFSTGP